MLSIPNFTTVNHSSIIVKSLPNSVYGKSNTLLFHYGFKSLEIKPTLLSNKASLLDIYISTQLNVPTSTKELLSSVETPFYMFFNMNFVDIPNCFRVNKSIKRSVNSHELMKLTNMFMRRGRKLHCLTLINNSLFQIAKLNYLHSSNVN